MLVIGECRVTGVNGRNLSGRKVLIFFEYGSFWPGDNYRIIEAVRLLLHLLRQPMCMNANSEEDVAAFCSCRCSKWEAFSVME